MSKFSEGHTYKWYVLIIVQCAFFLYGVDTTIVNIALPVMSKDLGLSVRLSQWIVSIFLIATAVALPIFGRVADVLGRKRVFVGGLIALAFSSFLCTMTTSLFSLVILRIIQGFGCAACTSNCNAIISAVIPPHRLGFAFGMNNTIYSIGVGAGVIGGGYLVEYFGWHSIFYLNAILGMLFALLAALVLIEEKITVKREGRQTFDYLGSMFFVLMIFGIQSGIINYLNPITTKNFSYLLISGGVFALLFFIFIEMRSKSPLVDLRLYKIFAFSNGNAIRFVVQMMTSAILFIIPFYVQESLGFSPSKSGLVLFPFTFGLLIFGPVGGHLGDKLGARSTILLGFVLAMISLIVLMKTDHIHEGKLSIWSIAHLSVGLFIYGISLCLITSANMNATLSAVPHAQKAVSSGLISTIGLMGGALGAAVDSQIISEKSSLFTDIALAVMHAKNTIFYLLIAFASMGALLSNFCSKRIVKSK